MVFLENNKNYDVRGKIADNADVSVKESKLKKEIASTCYYKYCGKGVVKVKCSKIYHPGCYTRAKISPNQTGDYLLCGMYWG